MDLEQAIAINFEQNVLKSATLRRFESFYIPEPNSGCWLWLGGVDKRGMGYGFFHMGSDHHTIKAHVASYRLFKGEPNGLCVLHTCDVPSCVNPDHLFLGTAQDNKDDCMRKGRAVFPCGEQHGRAILTKEIVQSIRADQRATRFVAQDYGLHPATVRKIRRCASWKHVP